VHADAIFRASAHFAVRKLVKVIEQHVRVDIRIGSCASVSTSVTPATPINSKSSYGRVSMWHACQTRAHERGLESYVLCMNVPRESAVQFRKRCRPGVQMGYLSQKTIIINGKSKQHG